MHRVSQLMGFAIDSLWRRKGKYVSLTCLYALTVSFFASIVFFTSSLRYETSEVLKNTPSIWLQNLEGGRLSPIHSSLIDTLSSIRGVKSVHERNWGYIFDAPTGGVFTVMGSNAAIQSYLQLPEPLSRPLSDDEVICGTGLLEMRGLRIGDRLVIQDSEGELRSFTIAGEFSSSLDLLTKDLIVLSPASAKQIVSLHDDTCTDLAIEVSNPSEVDNIARKIDRMLGGVRVVTRSQLLTTYETLFGWRGGIFLYGGLISMFAFLIFAWDRASGLSADERLEIATLKGLGWSIDDVLMTKGLEALSVSITATLVGLIIGYIHVFWIDAPLLKPS